MDSSEGTLKRVTRSQKEYATVSGVELECTSEEELNNPIGSIDLDLFQSQISDDERSSRDFPQTTEPVLESVNDQPPMENTKTISSINDLYALIMDMKRDQEQRDRRQQEHISSLMSEQKRELTEQADLLKSLKAGQDRQEKLIEESEKRLKDQIKRESEQQVSYFEERLAANQAALVAANKRIEDQCRQVHDELRKQLADNTSALKKDLTQHKVEVRATVEALQKETHATFHGLRETVNKQNNAQQALIGDCAAKYSHYEREFTAVRKSFQDMKLELNVVSETVKDLPQQIENVRTDISTLKEFRQTVQPTVDDLAIQITKMHVSAEAEVNKFLKESNIRINQQVNNWLGEQENKFQQRLANTSVVVSEELNGTSEPKVTSAVTQQCFHDRTDKEDSLSEEPVPCRRETVWCRRSNFEHSPSRNDVNVNVSPADDGINRIPNVTRGEYRNYSPSRHQGNYSARDTRNRTAPSTMDLKILKNRQFQTFSAEKDEPHPIVFIRGFRKIFPSNWDEYSKLQFIVSHITGEAALWANDVIEHCESTEEFEYLFTKKFFSASKQARLRKEIYYPAYYNPKKESLRNYFERYINKTRYLDRPMPLDEAINLLKGRLPIEIREKLMYVPDYDLETFLAHVDTLDIIEEDKRQMNGQQANNQYDHNTNRNGNSQNRRNGNGNNHNSYTNGYNNFQNFSNHPGRSNGRPNGNQKRGNRNRNNDNNFRNSHNNSFGYENNNNCNQDFSSNFQGQNQGNRNSNQCQSRNNNYQNNNNNNNNFNQNNNNNNSRKRTHDGNFRDNPPPNQGNWNGRSQHNQHPNTWNQPVNYIMVQPNENCNGTACCTGNMPCPMNVTPFEPHYAKPPGHNNGNQDRITEINDRNATSVPINPSN